MSVLIGIGVAVIFAYLLVQLAIGRSTRPDGRFASSQGDPGVVLWGGGDGGDGGGCAPGDGGGGCGDGGGGGGGGD